jgi:hypothetical protein
MRSRCVNAAVVRLVRVAEEMRAVGALRQGRESARLRAPGETEEGETREQAGRTLDWEARRPRQDWQMPMAGREAQVCAAASETAGAGCGGACMHGGAALEDVWHAGAHRGAQIAGRSVSCGGVWVN